MSKFALLIFGLALIATIVVALPTVNNNQELKFIQLIDW